MAVLAALCLLLLAGPRCLGQYPAGPDEAEEAPMETGPPDKMHIVGLFTQDEYQAILAFNSAIERINMDKRVLPHVELVPVVEVLDAEADGFAVSRKVCELVSRGASAIFGPSRREWINIVSSISETLEIPHMLAHYSALRRPTKVRVNVAPDRQSVSQAVVALLDDMAWKSFTILYEDDEALFRLQEVLKAHGPANQPVTVRRLQGEDGDYRPLLKEIRNSSETRIVMDVAPDKIMDVLRQARQVKMMDEYTSYLVTSLDAHTADYSELDEWRQQSTTVSNVTGLRLIATDGSIAQNTLQDWLYRERLRGNHPTLTVPKIETYAGLINDAVHMFARSLHLLNQTEPPVFEEPLSCEAAKTWEHGPRLVAFINSAYSNPDSEEWGMTGPLQLSADEEEGYGFRRTNFSLTLIETATNVGTGVWNASGIHLFRTVEEMERVTKDLLANKTLRVVSKLGPPYLMVKGDANYTEGCGNECLRGYSLDLIDEVSKKLNFKYEFYLVKDYGSLKDGVWNGIIKELLDRKADLGLCDLTITFDREQAVDFTMPFMTLGISILHTIPEPKETNRFSFLLPLSTEVWIYMAFAYVAVSFLLFALARVTPNEWDNPHPCDQNPEELENTFTLINSMWFVMGSFLQQGCDFLPKAASTRMVAGMWWFFVLIMISSYTANLAAFLTDSLSGDTINNAKDLAMQTSVQYGCLGAGSTRSFFQNSNVSDYQRMWDYMSKAKPSVFPNSNPEGVERVVKGKGSYAFLMESTGIEYQVARKCTLRQVGGLLDSKGYGIALPRNSPFRSLVSGAVLSLQESGVLTQLKNRWWNQYDGGDTCATERAKKPSSASDSNKLGLANVGGVFLVLIWGCVAAFFMAIIEFLWNTRTVAIENRISVSDAFWKELRFAVRFTESSKPVKHSTPTPSTSASRSVRSSRSHSATPSMARSAR